MRMLEAFKRLLDGEKITRPDWGGAYIIYDDDVYHNRFIGVSKGEVVGATKNPAFTESISCHKMIEFNFQGEEKSMIISLIDDDENEIYVSEEGKMELDAMRWRLEVYCMSLKNCSDCILKCKCPSIIGVLSYADLKNFAVEELKEMYNAIKEEGNNEE